MAPPVYTKRLCNLQNVTANEFSDPVPIGFRWVVRSMVANYGGTLFTTAQIGNPDIRIWTVTLTLEAPFAFWNGHIVLDEGERFQVVAGNLSEGFDFNAAGYELSLP